MNVFVKYPKTTMQNNGRFRSQIIYMVIPSWGYTATKCVKQRVNLKCFIFFRNKSLAAWLSNAVVFSLSNPSPARNGFGKYLIYVFIQFVIVFVVNIFY